LPQINKKERVSIPVTTVTPNWDVKLELTADLVFFHCSPQAFQIISGITLRVHSALFSPHDPLFLDNNSKQQQLNAQQLTRRFHGTYEITRLKHW